MSRDFRLSLADQVRLIAHYPLFKAAWHASYGHGWLQRFCKVAINWFSSHQTRVVAKGVDGERFVISIAFRMADLAAFEEVFWGAAYPVPPDSERWRSFVDLGANTGMASLFFLLKCRVNVAVVVEANVELISVLQKNLETAMTSRPAIQIRNCLVTGTSSGVIDFWIAEDHRMSSSADLVEPNPGVGKHVQVPQRPLRQLLDERQLEEVDVLKMDIEGAEYDILERDPAVFRRFRNIFAEIHGPREKREVFVRGLADLGFEIVSSAAAADESRRPVETLFARRVDGAVHHE